MLEQTRPMEPYEIDRTDAGPGARVFVMRRRGYRERMSPTDHYASKPAFEGRPFGLQHKVVGFISWFIVALCVIGVLRFPGRLSIAVGFVVAYLLTRMLFTLGFALRGSALCNEWKSRDWSDPSAVADLVTPRRPDPSPPLAPRDVHHIVIVPNYKETIGVLEATLSGLAAQSCAREQLTVVLAMEQKEPGSAEKGAALARRFASSFANVLVTVHPGNLPGEIACKGSNQAWAAREAKRFVLDELRLPTENVTITSCDADSILHPDYLAALSLMFAADPERHATFWQAPLFYYNNLWRVPTPVRFMGFITHALVLQQLANPLAKPLPISTYSLSLKMLDEIGYWDPAVISEDWHIYLQAFFARDGAVSLRRIFLPISADMPDGDSRWSALVNMYHQSVRHSWGAEDIGFVIQEWVATATPFFLTARLLYQVLVAHLLRSVPWFLFTAGSLLSLMTMRGHNPLPLHYPLLPQALQYLWWMSSVSMIVLLGIELHRNPPPKLWSLPARLFEIGAAWAFLPVITLAFGALPALYAQTKLMLGLGLSWRVTPKRLASQLNHS